MHDILNIFNNVYIIIIFIIISFMRKIQKFLSTNTGTLQNLNHLRKFYKEATIHKV